MRHNSQPGPIEFKILSRSVLFDPEAKGRVDCKYHSRVVREDVAGHFSFECYVKCTGGTGMRVALMSGRYGLVVST